MGGGGGGGKVTISILKPQLLKRIWESPQIDLNPHSQMCLLTAGPKRLRLAGEACSLLTVSISSPRLTSQRSHSQAGPKPKEVPRGRQQPETSGWEEERGDESRSSLLTLISLWPRPGVKGEAGQVQGQWMGVAWWAAAASSSLTQPHLGKGPPGFSLHRVDPPPPPLPYILWYCLQFSSFV